jgi:hypothetical protein
LSTKDDLPDKTGLVGTDTTVQNKQHQESVGVLMIIAVSAASTFDHMQQVHLYPDLGRSHSLCFLRLIFSLANEIVLSDDETDQIRTTA